MTFYMDDLVFLGAFVVLLIAALACHFTKAKWQKEDAIAQAAWDKEEADKSYRHEERSQVGPAQSQNLGRIRLLAWGFTFALIALAAARYSAAI